MYPFFKRIQMQIRIKEMRKLVDPGLYVKADSMCAIFWIFCTGNLMMYGFIKGVSVDV